jgi:hypothetical protein
VLRRYAATGTVDALLAEAESALVAVGGPSWSPVSATAESDRRPRPLETPGRHEEASAEGRGEPAASGRRRYVLIPDRSALLIEARSTVGPISFGTLGLTGYAAMTFNGGEISFDDPPTADVEVPVSGLCSGNRLYDAELLRRIDSKRYPVVSLHLHDCTALGVQHRFRIGGTATLHGVNRPLEGTVVATVGADGSLTVAGEHVLDIRDFGIELPTVLMLRIYPDVTVRLQVEAEWDELTRPE